MCRKINSRVVGRIKEAVAYFNIESAIALAVSLLINLFVLSVFAKGFYGREEGDIGLENAGQFLGRTFGLQMKYIWAVGLLAAGKSPPPPLNLPNIQPWRPEKLTWRKVTRSWEGPSGLR